MATSRFKISEGPKEAADSRKIDLHLSQSKTTSSSLPKPNKGDDALYSHQIIAVFLLFRSEFCRAKESLAVPRNKILSNIVNRMLKIRASSFVGMGVHHVENLLCTLMKSNEFDDHSAFRTLFSDLSDDQIAVEDPKIADRLPFWRIRKLLGRPLAQDAYIEVASQIREERDSAIDLNTKLTNGVEEMDKYIKGLRARMGDKDTQITDLSLQEPLDPATSGTLGCSKGVALSSRASDMMASVMLGSRVQSMKRKFSKSDIGVSEISQSKRLNRVSDAAADALGAISPYDSATGCAGSNESPISRTTSNNGQLAHSLTSSVLSEKDTFQDCGETEMEIIKARYNISVPNIQEGVSHASYKISHRKPEHNYVKFTTHTYECNVFVFGRGKKLPKLKQFAVDHTTERRYLGSEKSDVPLDKRGRPVSPRLLEFIFDDRYYHIAFQKEYLHVLEATTSEALWYFCADTLPHVLERWNWYSSESVELTNWKRALYNQEVPIIAVSFEDESQPIELLEDIEQLRHDTHHYNLVAKDTLKRYTTTCRRLCDKVRETKAGDKLEDMLASLEKGDIKGMLKAMLKPVIR